MSEPAQFGCIRIHSDTNFATSHKGYMENGEMKFEEAGVPVAFPVPAIVEQPKIDPEDRPWQWSAMLKCKGAGSYVRTLAMMKDCKITDMHVETHWFSETVHFTLTGKKRNVNAAEIQFHRDVEDYLNHR